MSLTQYSYSSGNYAEFVSRCEKTGKGMIALSLTNYDNNNNCEIAEGSVAEINGAVFRQESGNTAITGTPQNNAFNYIMLTVSGNAASASWNNTVPSWNTAYQSYYVGENRCIGGSYLDGANQVIKWVYEKMGYGPQDNWYTVDMLYGYPVEDGTHTYTSTYINISNGASCRMAIALPHNSIIKTLSMYCNGTLTSGGVTLKRQNHNNQVIVDCASQLDTGNNNTISYPLVSLDQHKYYIYIINNAGIARSIYGISIKVTEIKK